MTAAVQRLVPFAHVAEVQRSIDFYALLGFSVAGSHKNDAGRLYWAD